MGIFDKLYTRPESLTIIEIVKQQDMVGNKIYFDNLFYHGFNGEVDKNGENVYIRKDVEWVLVEESFEGDTDCILYSIDGEIKNTRTVDRQVISMVYLKLQEYVREFEQGNS